MRVDPGNMCDSRGLMETTSAAPIEFRCPRCATAVAEVFYGPCDACRAALRASLGSEPSNLVAGGFDPKMNVTPNAVALKDD